MGAGSSNGRRETSSHGCLGTGTSATFDWSWRSWTVLQSDLPLSKQPKIRLRAAEDQPEQIVQRVAGLKQVVLDAGVLKPRGEAIVWLSGPPNKFSAWHRIVSRKLTTIVNAIQTYAELKGRSLMVAQRDLSERSTP